MNIRLDGKTAVVTGGAGGIGIACVRELLLSGASIAIVGSSREHTEAAAKQLEEMGSVRAYWQDLRDTAAIRTLVSRIREDMGEIDILVQAAALLGSADALEVKEAEWDNMMDVNSRALFFMMQQVVEQSMKVHGGAIVNFASMAGIRGMRLGMCSAPYSASKGAVIASSMQAAVEWAPYNIRVNALAPGGVLTPPMQNLQLPPEAYDPIPLRKLSQPEDVAALVTFLVSDRACMITGQTLVIDGGSSCVGY